jgi:hypothetical protein
MGKYACAIKNANEAVVKATLELLAKQGVKITNQIKDFYGNPTHVKYGVAVGDGIGIEVKNGQLEFVADTYNFKSQFEEFTRMFEQYYKATQTMMTLKTMGFQVNMVKAPNGKLMVGAMQ